MKKAKLLIIEDEQDIREGLDYILKKRFELEFATNGLEGLRKAIRNPPDLILLDLKMPEMDGFQTCKAIREDHELDLVPIIIVSAFNNVSDRTKLFELGADDYLTKPFDNEELIARIQRKLHSRTIKDFSPVSVDKLLYTGDLSLDILKQQTVFKNKIIPLSGIEFKILHLLLEHSGQLVSREMIMSWAWENQDVSPNLVNPHILSLRNKLRPINFSIQTRYGKGYILKDLN